MHERERGPETAAATTAPPQPLGRCQVCGAPHTAAEPVLCAVCGEPVLLWGWAP